MNTFKHFRLHAGEYTPRAFRKIVSIAIFVFFVVLATTAFTLAQTSTAHAAQRGPQPPAGQAPPQREPIPPVINPTETPAPGCEDRPRQGDLRARITDSPATTSAHFTNRSDTCSYRIGLAVYKRFDNNIDNQELYDYALAVIAPNSTLDLSVSNPPCAYQGDAFWGDLITAFAGGVRYGERRLADTDGVNTELCVRQPPTETPVALTETPAPPSSTPAPPTATNTVVPPSATSVPPSNTPVPPSATSVLPSNTPVPPTATSVPPSATSVPPTATNTAVPLTATSVPPTATNTVVPPTATNTTVPTTVPAPPGGNPPAPPAPVGNTAPPVAAITPQVSTAPPSRPAPVSQAAPLVGSNPEAPAHGPVSQAKPLVGTSDEPVSAPLPFTGMKDTLSFALAIATLAGLLAALGVLLRQRGMNRQ